MTTSSASADWPSPARAARKIAASPWCGTTPMTRRAPARRAAAAASEPLLPAAPSTATTGLALAPCAGATLRGQPDRRLAHHPVGQRRRTAHVEHRQRQRGGQVIGQHRGDRPAEQDRVAGARHLLARAVPAGQAVGDDQRGEAERDQGRHPVAGPRGRAASRGPASSTTPVSMPPEPVTGFCILPRLATISSTAARIAAGSPPMRLAQLPERRGVEVQPLDTDPHLVRPQLRAGVQPAAACGSTPAGSSTRCSPSGDPVPVIVLLTSPSLSRAASPRARW